MKFDTTVTYHFLGLNTLLMNFPTQITMFRRSPTRIELKLDDIQEYESMRREQESRKEQQTENHSLSAEQWAPGVPKTKQEIINERIGYVPQPRMT
jgi:anaphase-promoting complex subunit 12